MCERERVQLRERTCSLWWHMNSVPVLPRYLNPLYEPNKRVIWPSVAPMSLSLWPGMYLRWTVDLSAQRAALQRSVSGGMAGMVCVCGGGVLEGGWESTQDGEVDKDGCWLLGW